MYFGSLMVVILVVFLWGMYREVESTLLEAGVQRAEDGVEEISELLAQAVLLLSAEQNRIRSTPELSRYLRNPTEENGEAVRAVLTPDQPFRRLEVWDANGTLLLEVATPRADSVTSPRFMPRGAPPRGEGLSEIKAIGETGYFESVIAITGPGSPDSPLLGYVRRFGQIASSSEGRIGSLIGEGATIRIGSPDAGVWTDFFSVVDPPPSEEALEAGNGMADGWVGAYASVAGTPWRVWVGIPTRVVVAPAVDFLRRTLPLGLLFTAGGVFLAGLLGVRLTRPLLELSGAAEEIAAGDYTRRVGNGRNDELGRLSDAFNRMVDRIQEAHDALQESHEQTNFTLAVGRIGVWRADLRTGTMVCSDSLKEVHGIPDDRGLPTSREEFLSHVHEEDRDDVRRLLEGSSPPGQVFDLECRVHWPNGSIRWIEGKGTVEVDDKGRPESVLGVSIDITERRKLETQLRQAQKMEAVGRLAGGVAHDFNNLLTAIVGHANLMLFDIPESSPLREDVAGILKASESAAALTRQLLTFSRRQIVQPETVDVNAVLRETDRLLRRLIGEDIELVTNLDPDLATVTIDPGHLEQVVMNLAVNARDAMPGGGTLTIRTANVDLTDAYLYDGVEGDSGPFVMISVADTGVGMDAETQARLFEPFFTTKQPGEGTGLGLATVFGIVEQAGGQIYVYSEPGCGATFKVYLPASGQSAPATQSSEGAARLAGGDELILVVEDHAPVRRIAQTALERLGYQVLVAASGEEALELIDTTGARPDLVLSDVVMPGITGPELCRRLQERFPQIRVLFTSGYSGEALDRHGVQSTGAMFIEKPYTPTGLVMKVREALEKGSIQRLNA